VDAEKWRFVNSESLVDQMTERLLFSTQDEAEIRLWSVTPSKPGMGLTDEHAEMLMDYARKNELGMKSDCSGWDNTVPRQLLDADVEMRVRLAIDPADGWVRAVRARNVISCRRVMELSDGTLVVRRVPGGMASGRKVTSSSNSRMRALVGAVLAAKFEYVPGGMFMGDDAVERVPPRCQKSVAQYAASALGVKLSEAEPCSPDDFQFCSHRFWRDDGKVRVVPVNPGKMLVRAFAKDAKVDQEMLENYAFALRHHPNRDQYLAGLQSIGQGVGGRPENKS